MLGCDALHINVLEQAEALYMYTLFQAEFVSFFIHSFLPCALNLDELAVCEEGIHLVTEHESRARPYFRLQ
jgi:hypothetical protein